jgi:Domain of unknown function (DUF1931)
VSRKPLPVQCRADYIANIWPLISLPGPPQLTPGAGRAFSPERTYTMRPPSAFDRLARSSLTARRRSGRRGAAPIVADVGHAPTSPALARVPCEEVVRRRRPASFAIAQPVVWVCHLATSSTGRSTICCFAARRRPRRMAVTSQPSDLPITKWLQESIHQFWKLDEEIELSARPHLHHHRPRAEEPPDQALGAGIPDFRSAAVDRSGSQLWSPRSSGVWRALTTGTTGPAAVESFPATTRLP